MEYDKKASMSLKQITIGKHGRRRPYKAFQCSVEHCGKVYSRAEHLSRHQLNHDPKEIYRCDVPDCNRSFVRIDLHVRHRARHMGEYLQQDDNRSSSEPNDIRPLLESINYTEGTMMEHDSQPQLSPPYVIDLKSSAMPTPQSQGGTGFLFHEANTQAPLISDHMHQHPMIQQDQQLLDVDIWRNKVSATTGVLTFGGDIYARSPFTIPDDFIQFLFNGNNVAAATNNSNTTLNTFSDYSNTRGQFSENIYRDFFSESYLPQITPNIVPYDANLPLKELSHEKSQKIYDLVRNKLTDKNHTPGVDYKNSLLEGDRSQDFNIMSRHMMQSHIDNYWRKFHSQLPILHRPTFSPNETPNLLLIAIMILGASSSIKDDDHAMAKTTTEFSTVLAWYLRWEIFSSMHTHSNDIWVFQALLLLETFEKTYSSRTLHERAHIHHATTITLMRRRSFLTGRPPLESPPSYEENHSETEIMARSLKEVWWEDWIRREATRRVAFAAFMIDSTHAAMFGHSMAMVTHEMRLALPCDEVLWSATTVDEVRKIETTLRANGVKPLSFLEGLQRTLNGQEMYTNAFGRSVLLSGLLSVSWHMNQRDLQLNSLEVGSPEKERGTKWRRSITRAFDLWRGAYEQAVETMSKNIPGWYQSEEAVLGNRAALYHLARFSMYVDIVECQVFAGASRVLGRSIGKEDVETARWRIRTKWAPTVEARKATFYALRFLGSIFHRNAENGEQVSDRDFVLDYATSKTALPMHRWVLYSAALVIWCYSYAVDGPVHVAGSTGFSIDEHIQDMKNFLKRAENIKSPEDIAYHRLNGCAGMLKVLRYIFRKGTWELLHEGADLLTNCIKLVDRVE